MPRAVLVHLTALSLLVTRFAGLRKIRLRVGFYVLPIVDMARNTAFVVLLLSQTPVAQQLLHQILGRRLGQELILNYIGMTPFVSLQRWTVHGLRLLRTCFRLFGTTSLLPTVETKSTVSPLPFLVVPDSRLLRIPLKRMPSGTSSAIQSWTN